MNKFEQEVRRIVSKYFNGINSPTAIRKIRSLHDKEMIAFAEFTGKYVRLKGHNRWNVNGQYKTTSELLTIFREENK